MPNSKHGITRREFGILTAGALISSTRTFRQTSVQSSGTAGPVLDIADWSYYWYGVERVKLARGTMVNGSQLYVEHWIPAQIRHPYAVVLIHGGYGQGSDWFSTPDGRRGWATMFLEQGYKVYVVDRPGQGRNPHHPWVHGAYDAQAPTFERVAASVKSAQWPGNGTPADPAAAQVAAAMGQPMAINAITMDVWRSRGAMLLDDIGASILVTHGDGAIFAWVTATALERPALVKGIVAVEQSAQSVQVLTPQQRAKLSGMPVAIVTAEASPSNATDPNIAAGLRNAGAAVDHIRLADRGIRGNGPMVIVERNNRDALQPVLEWLRDRRERVPAANQASQSVAGGAPAVIPSADTNRNTEFTGMRLADQGGFFIGIRRKSMPYGTIPQGQMFVQY